MTKKKLKEIHPAVGDIFRVKKDKDGTGIKYITIPRQNELNYGAFNCIALTGPYRGCVMYVTTEELYQIVILDKKNPTVKKKKKVEWVEPKYGCSADDVN